MRKFFEHSCTQRQKVVQTRCGREPCWQHRSINATKLVIESLVRLISYIQPTTLAGNIVLLGTKFEDCKLVVSGRIFSMRSARFKTSFRRSIADADDNHFVHFPDVWATNSSLSQQRRICNHFVRRRIKYGRHSCITMVCWKHFLVVVPREILSVNVACVSPVSHSDKHISFAMLDHVPPVHFHAGYAFWRTARRSFA